MIALSVLHKPDVRPENQLPRKHIEEQSPPASWASVTNDNHNIGVPKMAAKDLFFHKFELKLAATAVVMGVVSFIKGLL
jgi:hypothetical protein